MTGLDLAYTSAVDLARMIAAKEISPVEVVSNSLARIDQLHLKATHNSEKAMLHRPRIGCGHSA